MIIKSRIPVFVCYIGLLSALSILNAQDFRVTMDTPSENDAFHFIQENAPLSDAVPGFRWPAVLKSIISEAYIIDSLAYKQSGISYKDIIAYSDTSNSFTILKQKYQDNHQLSTYMYDEKGNLLSELLEDWDLNSGKWVKNNRKTSSYDEQDNQLTYLYENWDNENELWEATRRYTNTYDDQNNQLTQLLEDWNSSSSSWSTNYMITFTYDEAGNRLSTEWDYISNIWKDDWRYTFTYDNTGNLETYLQEIRKPNTTEWINSTKFLYSYDVNGNLLIQQTERWNIYTNEWYQAERTVSTYDNAGNLVERVYEVPIPDSDQWKATSYRFFFSYNENNELIYELTEKWDIVDSTWFEYSKLNYDYDASGNLVYFTAIRIDKGFWKPFNHTLTFEINEKSISYPVEELSVYYTAAAPKSAENDLLSFVFEALDPIVSATISGTDVTAVVPLNTDVSELVPTIEVSDLATVNPASGIAQDFSSPVVYTVTAENGDEKSYTVEVEVSTGIAALNPGESFSIYPNPAKTFVSLSSAQNVEIFNAKGLMIKTLENVSLIQISDLNPGVYVIRNSSGNIKMLVVQ
jgi:hypothetical protein